MSKEIEGKTPIIVSKRKEFNFYEGQTYSKYEPIPLVSKGWHHYKSKGDYFFVYPLTDVRYDSLSFHCLSFPHIVFNFMILTHI